MSAFLLLWTLFFAPAQAQEDARQQAAEQSFDTIMMQNAVAPKKAAPPPPQAAATPAEAAPINPTPYLVPPSAPLSGEVEVSLLRYETTRSLIEKAEAEAAKSYNTLVVLGGSTYTGRAVPGGLELHLQLQVTLLGPGFWKAVPVVGDEVAVVKASVGGAPVPLSNQNGYQVWITDAVGELTLDVELLVPARGPRGSLEYDFLVARTPITRFDCAFDDAGLEPKLQQAVRAEVKASASGTRLEAWLEPTSRIHLVGYKAQDDDEGRAAKVYVETLSLLSVEESSADLFTVMRYSILQAGNQRFDIFIPAGLTVVSADGAGAFRYTLEPSPEGTLLRGETAFPIRDRYEVSLRLSLSLTGDTLDVLPPRAVNAEREHGWLGVEVLGTIRIEEKGRDEAQSVDVTQLPAELVGNAVSPVLLGWRYHSAGAHVALGAERLPEREPAAGSVDEVHATTTLVPEGRARTELRIVLRNRLRHSLRLRLPEGVEIRGCQLDGQAVTPSRTEDGAVLLPLKRSAGERPEPFTLTLTLEGQAGRLSWFGLPSLHLPALELPVSSLRWDVQAPAAFLYTRLYGDIEEQSDPGYAWSEASDQTLLRYTRFWVAADQPVRVRFAYLRRWLRAPLMLAGAVGLLLFVRSKLGDRPSRLLAAARAQVEALRAPAEGEAPSLSWRWFGPLGKLLLLSCTGVLGMLAMGMFWWFVWLALHPLG